MITDYFSRDNHYLTTFLDVIPKSKTARTCSSGIISTSHLIPHHSQLPPMTAAQLLPRSLFALGMLREVRRQPNAIEAPRVSLNLPRPFIGIPPRKMHGQVSY
jgi:hypothetical protein